MKFTKIILLLVLFIPLGCATRTASEKIFDVNYQTPNLSIDQYKSPELRNKTQKRNVSVAVAISGGGHRAGNFAVGVLNELELVNCNGKIFNVLNEIDYISTVSGGGLAAGIYISTLYDYILDNGNSDKYSLRKLLSTNHRDIKRNLERGYHNILEKGLISIRSLGTNDRGDFLEEEFDRKILGSEHRNKSLTLGDVFISNNSNKTPITPIWIANATVYENGSIFPFHPMALKKYEVIQFMHNLKEYEIGDDYYSMPLAIGLKASASFPGAVPATTLTSSYDPKNKYIHLFDGGLADNLGVTTALRMLSTTKKNKKVLIIIDAYKGQPEPFSKQEGSPNAIQIYNRSTSISLDAWRIRHKWVIKQLSSSNIFCGEKVKVIYLAFDNLSKKLKEKVFKIRTDFNITKKQQNYLFEAAREIVTANKDMIINAIFGRSCIH